MSKIFWLLIFFGINSFSAEFPIGQFDCQEHRSLPNPTKFLIKIESVNLGSQVLPYFTVEADGSTHEGIASISREDRKITLNIEVGIRNFNRFRFENGKLLDGGSSGSIRCTPNGI